MTIIQDILNWATESLPTWQNDAIARLFAKQVLAPEDIDDLYALLKIEHGIIDPQKRTPNKLNLTQIPTAASTNTHVVLNAIKDLQHVNAIAENKRLPFGSNGLTVIYGDNGSGKSGYSRVLKRACCARDQTEPILPNAFLSTKPAGSAKATFEITINGTTQEVHWSDDQPAPESLSSLAIFDSRCARAYLDKEDDFAYVPYGLDILEGLANVCKKLKGMVDSELLQTTVDMEVFTSLRGNTTVGKLIENLSHATKLEQVEILTTISPEEESRRNILEKTLKEINPKERIAQLRSLAKRISKIVQNVTEKLQLVNDAASTKLKELDESYRTAQAAAVLVAEKFKIDTNLLHGTGGNAWKELFEAARKFSIEAYPDKKFPYLGSDAQCPLCQQPLLQGAERLVEFDKFVQQEVEKTAKARKEELLNAIKIFNAQDLSLGLDDVLFAEIEILDKNLALDTRTFEKVLTDRQANIKKALSSKVWEEVGVTPESTVYRLQSFINKLIQEAETLEKISDDAARTNMQIEFDELNVRVQLGALKSAVITAIKRLNHQAKLQKCLSALKTNAISAKTNNLAEKVISKELEEALNKEFNLLGAGNLKVSLQSRVNAGKALHKLKLELPQNRAPGEILSEGEQRAIAIGSFLAEVNIGGSLGGVIFDDPVSSLDHKRRERVAKRLAQESKKRQVIILTHDIYFLFVLMDEAKNLGVPIATQTLVRRPEGFGVIDNDLPFEGMGTKSRIAFLKNMHQETVKFFKAKNEPEYRRIIIDAYRLLRLAWERAVEEVLFRNVVQRFSKGISTQLLAGVTVDDTDYDIVNNAMTKCSNYAHDQALLGGTVIPEPAELLTDIDALEDWRLKIEKRNIETNKRRKN